MNKNKNISLTAIILILMGSNLTGAAVKFDTIQDLQSSRATTPAHQILLLSRFDKRIRTSDAYNNALTIMERDIDEVDQLKAEMAPEEKLGNRLKAKAKFARLMGYRFTQLDIHLLQNNLPAAQGILDTITDCLNTASFNDNYDEINGRQREINRRLSENEITDLGGAPNEIS